MYMKNIANKNDEQDELKKRKRESQKNSRYQHTRNSENLPVKSVFTDSVCITQGQWNFPGQKYIGLYNQ